MSRIAVVVACLRATACAFLLVACGHGDSPAKPGDPAPVMTTPTGVAAGGAVGVLAPPARERARLTRVALLRASPEEVVAMTLAFSSEGRDASLGLEEIALDAGRSALDRWNAVHYLWDLSPRECMGWWVKNFTLKISGVDESRHERFFAPYPCADEMARRGWVSIEALVRDLESGAGRSEEWKDLAVKVIQRITRNRAREAILAVEMQPGSSGLADRLGK